MVKEFVTYQDREVPKDGFRVYIYHKDGQQKLVNSWDEFKRHITDEEWFSTEIEAKYSKQNEAYQELFTIEELKEADKLSKTFNFEAKKRGRKKASK